MMQRSLPIAALLAAATALLPAASRVEAGPPACATPQPTHAYIDVDNDGCHSQGVDSDDITDLLAAGVFDAPAGTGLTIPLAARVTLPRDVAAVWSAPMALTINGKASTRGASISLTAAGPITIGGNLDAKGGASSITVGAEAPGSGDITLGTNAKLGAGASVTLDAGGSITLGDGAQLRAKDGSINATAGGAIVSLSRNKAKAGLKIALAAGTAAVIGDRALLQAETGLSVISNGPVEVGGRARLSSELSAVLLGVTAAGGGVSTSVVTVGERAKIQGSTEVRIEALQDVIIGGRAKLTGRGDTESGGGLVRLRGPRDVLLSEGASLQARDLVFASGGTVTLETGSKLRAVDAFGGIELVANSEVDAVGVGMKAFAMTVSSTTNGRVGLLDCKINGSGDNGSAIDINSNGTGVCDLTSSRFTGVNIDTDDCATVVGP